MNDAGLGSLPGGGAEIFHPEVRDQICEHKADARRWFETHRTAHELGLRSNCTMLYGHIEQPYHRIDHLIRLRELQDETGGFQTFIPLAFHPDNTGLSHIKKPSSLMDLRMMAVSRLMLDNFPHIKAYWIMLGIGTAQVALAYGADDLDGTVRHELIYHDAGATTPEMLSVEQLRRLIIEAGREPVERDTLYHRVERDGTAWQTGAKDYGRSLNVAAQKGLSTKCGAVVGSSSANQGLQKLTRQPERRRANSSVPARPIKANTTLVGSGMLVRMMKKSFLSISACVPARSLLGALLVVMSWLSRLTLIFVTYVRGTEAMSNQERSEVYVELSAPGQQIDIAVRCQIKASLRRKNRLWQKVIRAQIDRVNSNAVDFHNVDENRQLIGSAGFCSTDTQQRYRPSFVELNVINRLPRLRRHLKRQLSVRDVDCAIGRE